MINIFSPHNRRKVASVFTTFSVVAAIAMICPYTANCSDEYTKSIANVTKYQDSQEIELCSLDLTQTNDTYEFKSSNRPAYINSNAVQIKSEPDDESEIIFAADYASKVYIMGEDINQSNGWTKVYCNNVSGYVRTEYLSQEVLFIEDPQYIFISDATVLRSSPEISEDNIVQKLYQNNRFKQVGYNEDWIKIDYEGTNYYIDVAYYSSEMIFIEEEKTMYLSRSTYLKSEPSTSNSCNAIELEMGTKLKQLEYNSKWQKVEYNGKLYFVEKAFTTPYYSTYTPNSYTITFDDAEYSGDLATVIETAYSFIGKKYVWGSATPYATDCSGLTMQCYEKVGIQLPHKASKQANYGRDVMDEAMKPGDLIMFSSKYSSTISHVGIYVGDGMMIHAANSSTGCIASDLERYCHNGGTIRAVRRFIE